MNSRTHPCTVHRQKAGRVTNPDLRAGHPAGSRLYAGPAYLGGSAPAFGAHHKTLVLTVPEASSAPTETALAATVHPLPPCFQCASTEAITVPAPVHGKLNGAASPAIGPSGKHCCTGTRLPLKTADLPYNDAPRLQPCSGQAYQRTGQEWRKDPAVRSRTDRMPRHRGTLEPGRPIPGAASSDATHHDTPSPVQGGGPVHTTALQTHPRARHAPTRRSLR